MPFVGGKAPFGNMVQDAHYTSRRFDALGVSKMGSARARTLGVRDEVRMAPAKEVARAPTTSTMAVSRVPCVLGSPYVDIDCTNLVDDDRGFVDDDRGS